MANRQSASAEQPPLDGEFDPIYEWLDDGDTYLLRLNLPEFKKEDFRVHVDASGRLTVIGQGAPGSGSRPRMHKVFQLPPTANLDDITGRFDGAVLTLTVAKNQPPGAVALQQQTQTKEKAGQVTDERKDLQEDKAAAKVGSDEAEAAERRIQEEDKRKAEAPPPPSEEAKHDRRDQDDKARADYRAKVASEAARRIEAARARVAEAKAAAEREAKGGRWKERTAAEGFKWTEAVGNNKEVIATAIAAFTFGAFLSHRLFGRS